MLHRGNLPGFTGLMKHIGTGRGLYVPFDVAKGNDTKILGALNNNTICSSRNSQGPTSSSKSREISELNSKQASFPAVNFKEGFSDLTRV